MSNDNTESISAKLRQIADMRMSSVTMDCTIATRFGIKCADVTCGECKRKVLRSIADEIDAEMDELRDRFRVTHPMQAVGDIAAGKEVYPLLREAIERYYLPRPLFEDGEPVQLGSTVVDKLRGEIEVSRVCYTKSGWYFNESKTGGANSRPRKIVYDYGERVKRPKQMLDADGVPIEVGDTVYLVPGEHCDAYPLHGYEAGVEYTVGKNLNPEHVANGRVCITRGDCLYGYPMPEQVTHREPDTQERIDMDAQESSHDYWKCYGYACSKCPAMFDGKIPSEHYGVSTCLKAQKLDLLHRQRELDGRDA